jgi:integrase
VGRKAKGWIRQRGDVWYVGMTLRRKPGEKKGHVWERQVDPPEGSTVVTEEHADAVRAHMVDMYSRRMWDPEAPQKTAEEQAVTTVGGYARTWINTQSYESQPKDAAALDNYLAPSELGKMALADVRPRHVAAWIKWLKTQPSPRDGTLAPRTVRNIYDATRRAFAYARFEELIATNPAEGLPSGVLPEIADKDEDAREGWLFTHAEIETLIYDPRVPEPRRVYNALGFLTGMRPGETTAQRWRDWDRSLEPLTRLTVARARKSVSGKEGRTKTGARKLVPVHPALEAILRAWWESGWERFLGHAPTLDDLVIPNQEGAPRNTNRANRDFNRDLVKLGLRERHQYVMRHTFISRAQDDGADGSVLRWATHAPPRTAFDGYTRAQWKRLCEEVGKLRVGPGPVGKLADKLAADRRNENGRSFAAAGFVGARGFEPFSGPRHLPEPANRVPRRGSRAERRFPGSGTRYAGGASVPGSGDAALWRWHDQQLLAEFDAEDTTPGVSAPGGDA